MEPNQTLLRDREGPFGLRRPACGLVSFFLSAVLAHAGQVTNPGTGAQAAGGRPFAQSGWKL